MSFKIGIRNKSACHLTETALEQWNEDSRDSDHISRGASTCRLSVYVYSESTGNRTNRNLIALKIAIYYLQITTSLTYQIKLPT